MTKDETARALEELVELGLAERIYRPGETQPRYRLTELGRSRESEHPNSSIGR